MDIELGLIGAMILCLFAGAGLVLQDLWYGWILIVIGLGNLFEFNRRRGRNPAWKK